MKTHDVAKALAVLSKALKSVPNEDLDDFVQSLSRPAQRDSANIAVSLATLASLSSYGKAEWLNVINDYKLPIEIRPRDAARDVLGKLLNYLEENKEERERISREARIKSKSSSEVSSALQFLLRNG